MPSGLEERRLNPFGSLHVLKGDESMKRFLAFALGTAAGLNYLDTGKIYKILPGHKVRFWTATLGMGIFAAIVFYPFLVAPPLSY